MCFRKIFCKKRILLTLTLFFSIPAIVHGSNLTSIDNDFHAHDYKVHIGESGSENAEKLEEISKKIDDLEEKLNDIQNKEKTLESQVGYMEGQINLTTLKINESEKETILLKSQIASLSGKITRLESSLTDISEILLNRIVATYKTKSITPIFYIVSSNDFNQVVSRAKYIQAAQEHDKKLLYTIQSTKTSYQKQKSLRENKKEKLEIIQNQLSDQKKILNQQKIEKAYLLEITRQDEKRYQSLIAAARSEQSAIEGAIKQAIALLKDGSPISKGEQIAIIGNSGAPSCSTGPHLHFEIRKDDILQNPADYLKGIPVEWDNQPDGEFGFGGGWDWPIQSPIITQGYGMTYWARTGFYGGGSHSGIDMTSKSSTVIKAPESGTLYKGAVSCKGSPMNFVAIEHSDNVVSWYWHVK